MRVWMLTGREMLEDGTEGEELIALDGTDLHAVFIHAAASLSQLPLDHADDQAIDLTLSSRAISRKDDE